MQFSLSISLSAFLLFAGPVIGRLHPSCTCHNGDSYNWRITTTACTNYTKSSYQWGGALYDTPSGRCVADTKAKSDASISGDEWESACQAVAQSGFACASGVGTCYADPYNVFGSCWN